MVESRLLEYQGKITTDSLGPPLEGEQIVNFPDYKSPYGFTECVIAFHEGKIHKKGDYAAFFVDGHREYWENGRFVSAVSAYELQEKLPLD